MWGPTTGGRDERPTVGPALLFLELSSLSLVLLGSAATLAYSGFLRYVGDTVGLGAATGIGRPEAVVILLAGAFLWGAAQVGEGLRITEDRGDGDGNSDVVGRFR